MGGYIECTSEINNGSTFAIRIPFRPTDHPVATSIKKTSGDEQFHISPALAKLQIAGGLQGLHQGRASAGSTQGTIHGGVA
jgi:hypothetical protein